MNRSRLFVILWLMVFATSCASVSSVKVDYVHDPEFDFAALKSYDWLPVPSKSIRYPLILKQIKSEMDRQLYVRNYKNVTGNPDFFIAVHGGIQSTLAYDDWVYLQDKYDQYAIKRRIDMTQYTEDTLIFDFIDANTKGLIYRARATAYLSLETSAAKRAEKIHEAVATVLDSFMQITLTDASSVTTD
jgi:hypothetical protein